MFRRSKHLMLACGLSVLWACGDRELPTSPDARFNATGPVVAVDKGSAQDASSAAAGGLTWSAFSSGGIVTEELTGPAIAGVVPQGEAIADQSNFLGGGSTLLTVRIKNVNLPDGTVLGVTLDFTPVGSITLSRGEGTMSVDLGHFAVSRDQVRVKHGGVVILSGGFFT